VGILNVDESSTKKQECKDADSDTLPVQAGNLCVLAALRESFFYSTCKRLKQPASQKHDAITVNQHRQRAKDVSLIPQHLLHPQL
jgi:hypothetical protein